MEQKELLKQELERLEQNYKKVMAIDIEELKAKAIEDLLSSKNELDEKIDTVEEESEVFISHLKEMPVSEILSDLREKFPEALDKVKDTISDEFESCVNNTHEEVKSLAENIEKNFGTTLSNIDKYLSDAINLRVEKIEQIKGSIQVFEDKVEQFKSRIGQFGEDFKSVRSIVDDGVKSASAGIDGVAVALDETKEAMQSLAGI